MNKKGYLQHRDNVDDCFNIYLFIKGYKPPSPAVMRVIQNNISIMKLRHFLDEHFQVNYLLEDKNKNLVKIW